jgi:hypothetical protein
MFNTSGDILQAIADTLQQADVTNLPAQWTNIASTSQNRAYWQIVSVLSGRGFTPTQIAAWDRGAEFELSLALYYALKQGGSLANLNGKFIQTFDREAELKTVIYTTGGALQDPQGTAGLAGTDVMDASGDIFVWPDPASQNDFPGPGRGQPMDF